MFVFWGDGSQTAKDLVNSIIQLDLYLYSGSCLLCLLVRVQQEELQSDLCRFCAIWCTLAL